MAYTIFENGVTALSDTVLNQMQKGLMELVFPVGSTYITQTNTNPNTILGFGTWERIKGKVCVGLDEDDTDLYFDTIGKTGGEKKHTLTIDEMPSHSHAQYVTANPGSGGTGTRGDYSGEGSGYSIYPQGITTHSAGGGQSHNIVQPYEVVGYMWIRRS